MQDRISTIQPGNDPAGTYFVSRPSHRPHPAERHAEPVSAAAFIAAMRGTVTGEPLLDFPPLTGFVLTGR